ncbi:MAG TPA: DUF4173 domain-containing protein [Gemmatimonadales bacterium]|nr:DUF4173 domain-containing protein [Gemmatimonadales bacterium]
MSVVASRTKLGLEIAAVALAAGLAGDTLLRVIPWGLNVTICTVILVGAGLWLVRRNQIQPGPDAGWLAITALLLGAAFLRRDSEELAAYNVLALILTLALAAASLQRERVSTWYPFDYVRGVVTASFASVVGSLVLIFSDIQWRALPETGRLRHLRGALLGALIAAPLLVIFAGLFASADPVFNNILSNVFAFNIESVIQHTFLFMFWAALVAGYLRWGLLGSPLGLQFATPKPLATIVPIGTALGLLSFLFLMFVVVQLRYFFGGSAVIEETHGLTYAAYARQGFFQLVAASALVLPLLLGADHLVHGGTASHVRVFRQLAGLLLALLAVIMASALQRMRLYVAAYGLTSDRLYATALMILLIGVFAWFCWTMLRGVRHRFAFGALMQAFAVLAGLHVLNPDAFILKTNLSRPVEVRPFDARYASTLGADAVPVLLDALPRLNTEDRCIVVTRLLDRWVDGEHADSDWRNWNWSRARARSLLRDQAGALRASCPAQVKEQSHDH